MRKVIVVVMLVLIVVIIGASLVYIDANSRRAADAVRAEYESTQHEIDAKATRRVVCRDMAQTPTAYDLCMAIR